ncbi:MAG: hypothetical protein JXJ17_07770 [Anaerolineae bacterium]|nr:hypothetical protein [Anaerolineae bacterium]
MAESPLSDRLEQVTQAQAMVVGDFMKRRNVVACGVGYKITQGKLTDIPSVVVSVTKKESPENLPADDLIPDQVDSVLTDVIETGEIVAYSLDRQARQRPVRPGISVGHQSGSTGTFGCVVRRDDALFVLSNNHVLAYENQAEKGDFILQPGPADGGSLLDKIGVLSDFVALRFLESSTDSEAEGQSTEPSGCATLLSNLLSALSDLGQTKTADEVPLGPQLNYVDVAMARIDDSVSVDPRIVDVGGAPLGITEPELNMKVIKSGRTTGLTKAIILQIDVVVDVKYGSRKARFVNQIMTSPFSQPGDSGSLVLDYERNAVGLLFSGSGNIGVANPIQPVLTAMRAELVLEGEL